MSVKIELTDSEAESFKEWRENQDRFEVLLSGGVFDIRSGSASIFFNKDGVITNIRKDTVSYQRKRELSEPWDGDLSKWKIY